jgi:hypothetical protein
VSDQTESSIVPAAAAALVTSTKLAERTLAARAERQVQVARDGRTLIVSAEGPYTSIAAALAIAEATDTVLVQEGEYEEEAFALHGTQTVIGSDREDVAITITGGTILLQDSCRLEQLAIGGDPLADDSESAPLIRATGTPGLANVDIDVSSRDRGLQVVSGALRARDCELGRVEVMGGAIPSLEGCKLWGLRVAGAFPRLVDCDVWGGTVVSDAGGGTFEDCRLGISPARLWPPYGLVIRDAGTAPVVRRSVIVGGYRGVVFLGGAAGDLENCEITAAWSPGRLAVYIARTDGTGAIADLVERAEAIDVGRVFSSGLPLEATPERFFDPERRPAVAIWDRHTSPRLSRCVLYAPSAIDLDPASSPTLLDYRWIEADMDTGWRALAPPEGPNPDADGPFAAFNNKYLEERLQEYPRRARLWAELRDDVEAGEYD